MKIFMLFAVCLSLFVSLKAEQPIFRAGIITDTHVTEDKKPCSMLKGALSLFKTQNVDLVIHLGDIAQVYSSAAYRHYRDTMNKVFTDPDKSPMEIFTFANHDWIGRKSEPYLKVYNDAKKQLGVKHEPCVMLFPVCVSDRACLRREAIPEFSGTLSSLKKRKMFNRFFFSSASVMYAK